MIRAITSFIWLIAALALGFEAAAQPCLVMSKSQPVMMAASDHCEDMAMMQTAENADDRPDEERHGDVSCCCAALLSNGVIVAAPDVRQPLAGLALWAMPMPDLMRSRALDYEPPPPRA